MFVGILIIVILLLLELSILFKVNYTISDFFTVLVLFSNHFPISFFSVYSVLVYFLMSLKLFSVALKTELF